MNPALTFGGRNALNAVDAGLPMELSVGSVSHDLEYHFFNTAEGCLGDRYDLDAPTLALAKPPVHAEQVSSKQRRLVAAGPRSKLGDRVAIAERIARNEQ